MKGAVEGLVMEGEVAYVLVQLAVADDFDRIKIGDQVDLEVEPAALPGVTTSADAEEERVSEPSTETQEPAPRATLRQQTPADLLLETVPTDSRRATAVDLWSTR